MITGGGPCITNYIWGMFGCTCLIYICRFTGDLMRILTMLLRRLCEANGGEEVVTSISSSFMVIANPEIERANCQGSTQKILHCFVISVGPWSSLKSFPPLKINHLSQSIIGLNLLLSMSHFNLIMRKTWDSPSLLFFLIYIMCLCPNSPTAGHFFSIGVKCEFYERCHCSWGLGDFSYALNLWGLALTIY